MSEFPGLGGWSTEESMCDAGSIVEFQLSCFLLLAPLHMAGYVSHSRVVLRSLTGELGVIDVDPSVSARELANEVHMKSK